MKTWEEQIPDEIRKVERQASIGWGFTLLLASIPVIVWAGIGSLLWWMVEQVPHPPEAVYVFYAFWLGAFQLVYLLAGGFGVMGIPASLICFAVLVSI